MWIPKTEEELKLMAKKKEKIARIIGLLFPVFLFIFSTIYERYIDTTEVRHASLGPALSWSQVIDNLPISIVVYVFVGMLAYLIVKKLNSTTKVVCQKCGKVKKVDHVNDCACGGHFTSIDEIKWVEEQDTKK